MNHFHIGEDAAEVALLAANFLKTEIGQFNRYSWALSGGSSPKLLFALLAEDPAFSSLDWGKVEFYWGDERCVPPTDTESNFYWAHRLFFEPVGIDPEQVHRVLGEAEFLQDEAERYSGLIEHVSLYRGGLNLAMLGMGADGHTLSIFPGQEAVWESEAYSALSQHPETGQQRITLTERAILAARNLAFLITGESKAEVLDEIVHKKIGYDRYPTSWVMQLGKPIHWFLDREAARYLNKG